MIEPVGVFCSRAQFFAKVFGVENNLVQKSGLTPNHQKNS